MSRYDPAIYWNRREHPNSTERPGIGKAERDFLASFIRPSSVIFEFGPGVGRLFELYANRRVVTIDISKRYSSRLRAAAELHNIELDEHYRATEYESLPFGDYQFDVGVAAQVLFHVPFRSIDDTVRELTRVCKQLVVINGYDPRWLRLGDSGDLHCFNHDFLALSKRFGLDIKICRSSETGVPTLFTLCRP